MRDCDCGFVDTFILVTYIDYVASRLYEGEVRNKNALNCDVVLFILTNTYIFVLGLMKTEVDLLWLEVK